jgi:hypothetical protein
MTVYGCACLHCHSNSCTQQSSKCQVAFTRSDSLQASQAAGWPVCKPANCVQHCTLSDACCLSAAAAGAQTRLLAALTGRPCLSTAAATLAAAQQAPATPTAAAHRLPQASLLGSRTAASHSSSAGRAIWGTCVGGVLLALALSGSSTASAATLRVWCCCCTSCPACCCSLSCNY